MQILDPPLPKKFNEIFKPLQHNLSSISILRGLTRSNVYTDSIDPTWAVTSSNSRILVAGDTENPEVFKTVQKIVDIGTASGRRGFVIYYPEEAQKMDIGKHIHGVKVYPNQRNYYVLQLEKERHSDLPDGYRLEQITGDFLSREYENIELVKEEMQSERMGIGEFLEKSFGFCALKDNTIASWCMSEYNTGNRFEIGIETHPDYRRRGLAYGTANACLDYGRKNRYTSVGWHCWKKNEASNQLALRLGFSYVLEYTAEYLEVE